MRRNESSLRQKELPAWYERVYRLVTEREPEGEDSDFDGPYPEDFDEDISELESQSSGACDCASDASECECDHDERDSMDEDFVYSGSEAKYYPEYKEMREERKVELAGLRKEQGGTICYHKAREYEVEKEWTKLKQNQTPGVQGQKLNLDYDHAQPYIEFFWPDELGKRTNRQIMGHVHFDADTSPNLEAFEAPERAGPSSINIGVEGSGEDITVTFINQDLLKVVVPRSIACPRTRRSNTPELLEFVGISHHFEKRLRERDQERDQEEA